MEVKFARRPDAPTPSRSRASWLLLAAACVALWGYCWSGPATGSKPEPGAASDGEREPARRSPRSGRGACKAGGADPELLRRQLERLDRASSAARRCTALRQLAAIAADNDVPAAQISRYTRPHQPLEVRVCAVEALAACQSPGALEHLLALSERADRSLRLEVARALASRSEDAALARLHALAGEVASPWRVAACIALADAGAPEAVDAITAALSDALAPDRRALIGALGETRDPRALELLAGVLAGASRALDDAAIAALGVHGSPEATELLIQQLERRPASSLAVLHALVDSDAPGARQFVLVAAQDGQAHVDQDDALAVLSRSMDADVRGLMLSGLAHASGKRRAAALDYFNEHPDGEAVPALLALAHDASGLVDRSVLLALGASGSREAADALARLASDGGGEHAGAALHALANMPEQHERALGLALELRERAPRSVLKVLEALDPGDSRPARAALIEMTRRPDAAGVRAIQLLSSQADADSERVFAQLARDAAGARRDAALAALGASATESGMAVVREVLRSGDDDARSRAVEALGSGLGVKAEADLLAASQDRAPEVAQTAVYQLASIATPAALTRLEELVAAPDSGIVSTALRAIASDAPDRVAPAIDRILASSDADTLQGALIATSSLEPASANQLIEHALRHPDLGVAVDAIDALIDGSSDDAHVRARLGQLADDPALSGRARGYARMALETYGMAQRTHAID